MDEKKKNDELQTRRQFFKNAAKRILPIVGAIALSNPIIQASTRNEAPCSCYGTCSGGCYIACSGGCEQGCVGGCYTTCLTGCNITCQNTCRNSCGSVSDNRKWL